MHYLKLALIAEGSSDHRFLPLVLRRLTINLCANHATRMVDVDNEVLDLTAMRAADPTVASRSIRGRQILLETAGAFNVLFVHADGGGDPEAARAAHFDPLADWTAQQTTLATSRPVAVIPVREMEAWVLADGDALRSAFGTVLSNSDLGIPARARDVESVADPKQTLNQAYDRVVGRRRRRKERASNFLGSIGESVRLERLRQIPAFQDLDRDLRQALDDLGYFR